MNEGISNGEQLSDNELKALADMLFVYSELTEHMKRLKEEALGHAKTIANLKVEIERDNVIRHFLPSRGILDRVVRSADRLPSGYREKLENLPIF